MKRIALELRVWYDHGHFRDILFVMILYSILSTQTFFLLLKRMALLSVFI